MIGAFIIPTAVWQRRCCDQVVPCVCWQEPDMNPVLTGWARCDCRSVGLVVPPTDRVLPASWCEHHCSASAGTQRETTSIISSLFSCTFKEECAVFCRRIIRQCHCAAVCFCLVVNGRKITACFTKWIQNIWDGSCRIKFQLIQTVDRSQQMCNDPSNEEIRHLCHNRDRIFRRLWTLIISNSSSGSGQKPDQYLFFKSNICHVPPISISDNTRASVLAEFCLIWWRRRVWGGGEGPSWVCSSDSD